MLVQQVGSWVTQLLQLQLPRSRTIEPLKMPEQPSAVETISHYQISTQPARAVNIQPVSEKSMGESQGEQSQRGKACLPCVNSHVLTCAGLLNEAYRMSTDGLNDDSNERVQKCLAEFAAAERIDLSPENIVKLPTDEKEVAESAAKRIRTIRHDLEWLDDRDQLAELAAKTSELSKDIGNDWLKIRLKKMTKEEKIKLAVGAIERIEGEGK